MSQAGEGARTIYRNFFFNDPCRFARWKRDAEYWYIQDSLMFERLLGKVADELVRARYSRLPRDLSQLPTPERRD